MVARNAGRAGGRERERDRGGRGGRGRDREEPRGRGRDREEPEERGRGRGEDRGSRRNDRDREERSERRTPARGGGRYVYKERDAATVRRKAEAQGSGMFDSLIKPGIDTWKAAQGDNTIRILPPTWDDHDDCVYTIYTHNYIGPDESTYLCLRKMGKGHCPICDEAKACKDAGDDDGWKTYRPQERVALWIIDRDDKSDPPTPQFYHMHSRQWQDILKVSYDKKTGKVLSIDHPDNGYDLSIFRSGAGQRTRYSGFAFDREDSPIDPDEGVQDEIMEFVEKNPIPDVLNYYDEKYLESIVSGTAPERDRDAGEEEEEGRGRGKDRGRDREEPEERGRGRGRDREEPEPEERGRGRRGRDEPEEERGRGRGRGRDREEEPEPEEEVVEDEAGETDPPEEEERGRGRGRDREESRGRGRGRDDDPPPPRRGARGRDREEPEPEERGSRGRDRGGREGGRRYRD
jgi:hypothetical protein